jgi:cytochrome c-type biogenesis protein CcmH/NrfG
MDPNNVKCLYFRGNAFIELQEYGQAIDCLQKLVKLDPNHAEGRALFERAKKIKKDD